MELFIALLGLIFYFCAISGDKAKSRSFDRNFAANKTWFEARRDAFLGKVYRYEDFAEAKEFLFDHTKGQVAEVLEEAYAQLPSYKDIFDGDPFTNYFLGRMKTSGKKYRTRNDETERCVDWLLAKRGRIRQILYRDDGVGFPLGATERMKLEWDREYEFWMLILQEIREVAPEARMIFTLHGDSCHNDGVYDAEKDLATFRYQAGSLCWLQLTGYDDGLNHRF